MALFGSALLLRHFRPKARSATDSSDYPSISILKPLKGSDAGLYENLRSFFELDYPHFEILFCLESSGDPAFEIARNLASEFPKVSAQILTGLSAGSNPKIQNILKGYEAASYDKILISDSNVIVHKAYLKEIVSQFDASTGIVTSAVIGSSPRTFGAQLENIFLSTFYSRWMKLSSWAGFDCVVGKSMLFRKSDSEKFGGLKTLSCYLAEDYMAGVAMKHLNRKIVLSNRPLLQNLGNMSFKDFWNRHIRWGRMRKAQAPLAFFIEPFSYSLSSAAIGSSTMAFMWDMSFLKLFFAYVFIWMTADFLIFIRLHVENVAPYLRGFGLKWIIYWIAREVLALPLWIHISLGKTVLWRGTRLRIHSGGLITQP